MLRFALIGQPLGHSLSPLLHRYIAEAAGFSCEYLLRPLQPEGVRPFISGMAAAGLQGINVTIPYKLAALEAVDEVTATARAIGAVNTVAMMNGRTTGHNTDYYGFGAMLAAAGIDPAGRSATVLGSGGAARAAVAWLVDSGCEVTVASRSETPLFGAKAISFDSIGCGYLLVNATPVGMAPHVDGCPVAEETLRRFAAVADLVYNPRQTRLLQASSALGLACADGLYMLVAQAVRAQEIWQGIQLGQPVERAVYDRLNADWEGRNG